MGVSGGPNMTEEGVVFYYDTGNVKSYAGEPATNSQDADYAAFTQAGFDAWGNYDGSNAHTWDVNQSKTYVNIKGPDGNLTDAMLYHNFTGGFHGPTHWGGVPASLLTNGSRITVQGWVKAADTASAGKTVSPYLYYSRIGGGSYSAGTGHTLTAEWQLVSHSYTVPEGSTGTGIMYFFTSGGANIRMYLTKTAIVGGKLHPVQWLPGGTTRSATEGLLDFTKDTTIDLTNVSFDSDAQMTFDGTDDYVQTNVNTDSLGDVVSFEFIMNSSTIVKSPIISGYLGASPVENRWDIQLSRLGGSDIRLVFHADSSGVSSNSTFLPDTFYHIVFTIDTTVSSSSVYVNGTLDRTAAANYALNTGVNLLIGDGDGTNYAGKLPLIKIYDRVLTAEEVQNNFNGIRNRFGI